MNATTPNQDHETIVSKWSSRHSPKGGPRLKQVVTKIKLGYKRADGKMAYRSVTKHVPV